MPVKTDPPQRPRTLARRINGILSACIVVFFLAHGILGSMLPFTGFESPLAWLVWAGVACVVVHIVLSIVTSREQLTDTVRPPSEAKKRHLLLKWITGILLAVVVVAHIVTIRVLGPEAVQSMVVGAALIIVLAVVMASHICFGSKSLLKDLDVDRRWRGALRAIVCALAAVIGIAALVAVIA